MITSNLCDFVSKLNARNTIFLYQNTDSGTLSNGCLVWLSFCCQQFVRVFNRTTCLPEKRAAFRNVEIDDKEHFMPLFDNKFIYKGINSLGVRFSLLTLKEVKE